jgi:hypothetical protein
MVPVLARKDMWGLLHFYMPRRDEIARARRFVVKLKHERLGAVVACKARWWGSALKHGQEVKAGREDQTTEKQRPLHCIPAHPRGGFQPSATLFISCCFF